MWRTALVIGVALVACALAASIGLLSASGGLRRGDNNITRPPQPQSNLPTATVPATVSADTRLGGTLAAFEASYGRPTTITSQGVYAWSAVPLGATRVALQLTLATGQDGAPHVATVTILPLGATWATQSAFALAQRFVPADATYVRTQTSNPNYLIHFNTSASLNATFGVARANGDAGGASASRQFVVSCHLTQAGAQSVDRCILAMVTPHGDD